MPTFTASLTMTSGDSVPAGLNIPRRITVPFTLEYVEDSQKTVNVPANTTDFPVALDSVSAPKVLFVRTLNAAVTVSLINGADDVPTTLAAESGWFLFISQTGQPINQLTITTTSTPVGGARVEVMAFE